MPLGTYHIRAVAHQPHRNRRPAPPRFFDHAQRLVQAPGDAIAVAGFETLFDARGIHLDTQIARAVQRGREWLRAAHPAHAAGDD